MFYERTFAQNYIDMKNMVHILLRLTRKLIGTSARLLTWAAITVGFHPFPKDFQWHLQVMSLKLDLILFLLEEILQWEQSSIMSQRNRVNFQKDWFTWGWTCISCIFSYLFSKSHLYHFSFYINWPIDRKLLISRNGLYSPVGDFWMLFQMYISEHWNSGWYPCFAMLVRSIEIIICFRHPFLEAYLPNIPWQLEDWSSKMGACWFLIHQNA